jgi:hypothetical protein
MTWLERHPIRTDSKSIALLAIFAAMVIAIEAFPIPGITDIPLDPSGRFTIDPTGIPIVIVFEGLGFLFSLITIAAMWIAIGYRNPIGATFKGFAETYTILGMIVARILVRRWNYDRRLRIILYLIFGCVFRAVGMFLTNIPLLQVLYGLPLDAAVVGSAAYVVLNIIQASINIVGGLALYYLIPENLALQAGLGDDADSASSRVEELPLEEIESSQPDDPGNGGQG